MKLIKKIIRLILLAVLLITVTVIAGGWGKYKQAVAQKSIDLAVSEIRNGKNFTKYSEISPTLVKAIVSVEDRRFYKHKGVDIKGIGRAIKFNIENREIMQGGSCITQQLAKNMYFMNDDSITRKVAEVFAAIEIEKRYSKEEILELYLNVIYYGNGYYTIKEATEGYFEKAPDTLTDFEATLLAGVPNAPSVYSPKRSMKLAKQRQKTVVNAMVDMKYLTKKEADNILSQQ